MFLTPPTTMPQGGGVVTTMMSTVRLLWASSRLLRPAYSTVSICCVYIVARHRFIADVHVHVFFFVGVLAEAPAPSIERGLMLAEMGVQLCFDANMKLEQLAYKGYDVDHPMHPNVRLVASTEDTKQHLTADDGRRCLPPSQCHDYVADAIDAKKKKKVSLTGGYVLCTCTTCTCPSLYA